jgi:hypothetical protein
VFEISVSDRHWRRFFSRIRVRLLAVDVLTVDVLTVDVLAVDVLVVALVGLSAMAAGSPSVMLAADLSMLAAVKMSIGWKWWISL